MRLPGSSLRRMFRTEGVASLSPAAQAVWVERRTAESHVGRTSSYAREDPLVQLARSPSFLLSSPMPPPFYPLFFVVSSFIPHPSSFLVGVSPGSTPWARPAGVGRRSATCSASRSRARFRRRCTVFSETPTTAAVSAWVGPWMRTGSSNTSPLGHPASPRSLMPCGGRRG